MNTITKLFRPIKIGSLELPNRIIMPATTTNYDFDSLERQVQFFSARARGGVGLITVGALQTIYPGKRHLREQNMFQIGNMGHIYEEDCRGFLDVLEETLQEFMVHITPNTDRFSSSGN